MVSAEVWEDGVAGGADEGEVWLVVAVERGGDADDDDVGFGDAGEVGGGGERAGGDGGADAVRGDVLDVGVAGVEGVDFALIDVEADDADIFFCEAEDEGEADVAEAEDADGGGAGGEFVFRGHGSGEGRALRWEEEMSGDGDEAGEGSGGAGETVEFVEGHAGDLVHVVVLIGGEAAAEADGGFGGGEGLVLEVEGFGIRGGDGVVGFAVRGVGEWEFADEVGVWGLLGGGVLDFDDACEVEVVRVVDLEGGLPEVLVAGDVGAVGGGELGAGEGFGFEAERAPWEAAVAEAEVGVDGAGVDGVGGLEVAASVHEVRVEEDAEVGRGVDEPFEHAGVALSGEGLEVFAEVAVVAGGADGDAGADGGVEVAWFAAPLFAGVAVEEAFVEFGACD